MKKNGPTWKDLIEWDKLLGGVAAWWHSGAKHQPKTVRAHVWTYPETLQSAVGHAETAPALSISIPSTDFDSLNGTSWTCAPPLCTAIQWSSSILLSVLHLWWHDLHKENKTIVFHLDNLRYALCLCYLQFGCYFLEKLYTKQIEPSITVQTLLSISQY